MKISKKGISPLIATVLIIGFTVALAAVIMTWGSRFTSELQQQSDEATAQQMACTREVSLKIKSVCYDSTAASLQLTLENANSRVINKVNIRAFQSATEVGSVEQDTLADLTAYGIKTYPLTTIGALDLAKVKEVEVIPIVDIEGKVVTCAGSGAKFGQTSATTARESIAACKTS